MVQEKALVGALSVIVKTDCDTDGSFYSTSCDKNGHESSGPTALIRLSLVRDDPRPDKKWTRFSQQRFVFQKLPTPHLSMCVNLSIECYSALTLFRN